MYDTLSFSRGVGIRADVRFMARGFGSERGVVEMAWDWKGEINKREGGNEECVLEGREQQGWVAGRNDGGGEMGEGMECVTGRTAFVDVGVGGKGFDWERWLCCNGMV